jgi:hypothetical protein
MSKIINKDFLFLSEKLKKNGIKEFRKNSLKK